MASADSSVNHLRPAARAALGAGVETFLRQLAHAAAAAAGSGSAGTGGRSTTKVTAEQVYVPRSQKSLRLGVAVNSRDLTCFNDADHVLFTQILATTS